MKKNFNSINDFTMSRKISPVEQNKILMRFLEDVTEYSSSKNVIRQISNLLKLSNEIIKFELKYYFFLKFENCQNKFKARSNFFQIFFSYIKTCLVFFYLLIFSKRNIKKISYDLIVDDVAYGQEYERTKELASKFEKYLIVGSLKKKDKFYYNFNYKGVDIKLILKTFNVNYFLTLNKFLFLSIKYNINLVDTLLYLSKLKLKYDFLFSYFKGKFLFQERHTHTSKIKNYFFKKHGGICTSLIQKNIIHLNGPGSFCNSDVIFTLGKKTHEKFSKVGIEVKKIIPVGSFYVNVNYFNQPKIEKSKKNLYQYDLINFASRMTYHQDTHFKFMDDWYEHFFWLSKFSKEFPNLKIAIKHRSTNNLDKDPKLKKILKDSNVKIIIGEKYLDTITSYNYAFNNSKALCTWTSTVAFEMIGHKIPCLIMDPGGRNKSFFADDDFDNKFKVTSYDQFKEKVNLILKNKEIFNFEDSDDYCLNSRNTIDRIVSNLKTYEKN